MDTKRDASPSRRKLTQEHQLTGRVLPEVKNVWERIVSDLKAEGVRVAGDKLNSELALNALILGLEQYSTASIRKVIEGGAKTYEHKIAMPTPERPGKDDLVAALSAKDEPRPSPKAAELAGRTALPAEPPARPRKRNGSGRGVKK